MDLVLSSLSEGLLWSIMAIGIFLTFRILDIADMTAEGLSRLERQSLHPKFKRVKPMASNPLFYFCRDVSRSSFWPPSY